MESDKVWQIISGHRVRTWQRWGSCHLLLGSPHPGSPACTPHLRNQRTLVFCNVDEPGLSAKHWNQLIRVNHMAQLVADGESTIHPGLFF